MTDETKDPREGEKKKRDAELDEFWDIDALIPKRRAPHYTANTETAEIELEPTSQGKSIPRSGWESIPPRGKSGADPSASIVKRRFIPPHTADEERSRPAPESEYAPDNALIRLVRVFPWKSNYRYYEGFVRDAERLIAVQGAECSRVPFFSYVPQYSQMNRAQLEWYLWWRANLRRGVYLDTDYSYVLLYVFELINLSDRTDPLSARDSLCHVWVHYRDTFHQLDSYLPEWICDCSLLHRLPPPAFETNALLTAAMSHCTLKEFYVPTGGADGYLRALLAFCSNYDYRKSKFCVGENVALFDRSVLGALRVLTEHTARDGKLFTSVKMDDSKLMRDAYMGALCSCGIKRRIEVEFCSFSRSHELRYMITDVVKYTENKIRAALGIRSRLSVYALPTSVRELLNTYLDTALPKRERAVEQKAAEPAEYEKLYDLPQKEFSLRDAAEIERASWDTTSRLIEAFGGGEGEAAETESSASIVGAAPLESSERISVDCTAVADELAAAPLFATDPFAVSFSDADETDGDALAKAFADYRPFLRAVREGDPNGQRDEAKRRGMPLEVLVDEINALAVDLTGDILLEECDRGYAVIEEYRQLLLVLTCDD